MLILNEPICGGVSYSCLQLVPKELNNILFVAFHTNAIGGHLNPNRTFHCLHLCFFWPKMFGYIKQMCQVCLMCTLSNPNRGKPSERVYIFSIKASFLVMHFDAYAADKPVGFEGSDSYLIGC